MKQSRYGRDAYFCPIFPSRCICKKLCSPCKDFTKGSYASERGMRVDHDSMSEVWYGPLGCPVGVVQIWSACYGWDVTDGTKVPPI